MVDSVDRNADFRHALKSLLSWEPFASGGSAYSRAFRIATVAAKERIEKWSAYRMAWAIESADGSGRYDNAVQDLANAENWAKAGEHELDTSHFGEIKLHAYMSDVKRRIEDGWGRVPFDVEKGSARLPVEHS